MKQKRPINLNLATMQFPPMAIASILHRISGLVLFLLLPWILYLLHASLGSPESFQQTQLFLQHPLQKLILWAFTSALLYHLLAGIRHMIMDLGYGEDVCTGRKSAVVVIVLAIVLTLLAGVWIW